MIAAAPGTMRVMNAIDVVPDWRPQSFGSKRADAIRDPIVEPLWSGLRFLGAVADDHAILQDVDGEPLDGLPAMAEALIDAVGGIGVIVDGYVTAELATDGTGTFTGGVTDPAARVTTRNLVGVRPGSDEQRLDKGQAARMPRAEDPVALVLVDLLWLDGEPLLDIPLLERRRQLESVITETDLVRCGIFVRPPIDTWVGSWRAMGFPGLSFKSANGRYSPGAPAPDWASVAMPRR